MNESKSTSPTSLFSIGNKQGERSPKGFQGIKTPTIEFEKAIDTLRTAHARVLSSYESDITTLRASISLLYSQISEKDDEIKRLHTHIVVLEGENSSLQKEAADILEKYSKWRSNAYELEKFRKAIIGMLGTSAIINVDDEFLKERPKRTSSFEEEDPNETTFSSEKRLQEEVCLLR
ncbi:hypothetical protein MDAP_000370 [Mitosporidium daphniae]